MNEKDAIKLAESNWWENKTPEEIVAFQLYEGKLCMPFDKFHEAVEKALKRPVWTHEFARPEILRAEFEKKIPRRTVADSFNLLQELAKDKQIIVVVPKDNKGETR